MTDSLIGLACGMLAVTAAFGLIGQAGTRQAAMQHGAYIAGMLGTTILSLAALAHGLQASSLLHFFDPTGRALSVALVGLVAAWLPILRVRSLAATAEAGLWWSLALVAALTGWAEFSSDASGIPPTSVLAAGLVLLLAGGLAISTWGQAAAALRPQPESNSLLACRRQLTIEVALVLLALTISSIQHMLWVGSLWPQAASFKVAAGAWLFLLSARLMQNRRSGAWLTLASTSVLIIALMSPIPWSQ